MNDKDNRSDHKFPAPWRHHEPTKEDKNEALRIFELDGQLENSSRIFPYEFSEQERESILEVFPDGTKEIAVEEFLVHLGFAIGSYKHWEEFPKERASFKRLYAELKKIRNYSDKLSMAINRLPADFRERIDVGVCMGMLRDPQFAELPSKPRYWSADWSSSFAHELATLQQVADDVEKHFKKKNTGGRDTDGQMTLLAREMLAAYAACFDEIPPISESHPFAKILNIVVKIVGRYGAGHFSVMHYVGKVVAEIRPDSPTE